ncbi:glutathione ABC transporter ATP-binding protein [Actinoalloteichus sp. AHMU CJ021]|uniref:ABC transporter ATP-binding protein n=1 Tax=Actinoalloteichus TaxID=65496 RepID=UPI000CA04B59|nr:glutathione ABC transporter ATP-binding protein [Actinoalloteichus sp. AHMU CJ021]
MSTTASGTAHEEAAEVEPVLRLTDLSVGFRTEDGPVRATTGVGFDVRPGEVLAVVGESGSGKSVSAMSLLGLLPPSATVTGSATLAGEELVGMPERRLRALRGNEIAMIFQEPMTSLNPVFTVGWQLGEVLREHRGLSRAAARERSRELLELVGIPEAARRLDSYPHQMSGGQRQRVMIAMAVACDPRVLVADEPTTALDVTVQAEILDLLRDLCRRLGTAIVLITHDMGVVADIADRVVVMRDGQVVERGDVRQVLTAPRHEYTATLLAAVPHLGRPRSDGPGAAGADTATGAERPSPAAPEPASGGTEPSPQVVEPGVAEPGTGEPEVAHEDAATPPTRRGAPVVTTPRAGGRAATADVVDVPPALELRDLVVEYHQVRAVREVSVTVGAGEVVGLVGESGSGKSTVGRCAAGLQRPTSGTVRVAGHDITALSARRLRPLRRDFSIVFQDPASSLNPRMTIGESIAEPLRMHRVSRGAGLRDRVAELLESVSLRADMHVRYPHELSGGQRQRVSIARALALEPKLLIADEPTSALDVSVQANVLRLFVDLQRRLGFACLFISHDLAVVEMLTSHVAVMRRGEIVESGPTGAVLAEPSHEYTRALLAAAPVPDPDEQRRRREARA